MHESEAGSQQNRMSPEERIRLETENEELRRSLKTLQENYERYLGLYEFSPVGYLTLDTHRIIQEINLAGAALLGRERGSLIGEDFTGFVDPEFQENLDCYIDRVLRIAIEQCCEVRLLRPNGTSPLVQMTSTVIVKEKGAIREIFISMTDISERERAEDALQRLNEQLERRIRDRTLKLERAEENIRTLAHQIISAQEEERQMISRELHDTLAQDLSYAKMVLKSLPHFGPSECPGDEEVRRVCDVLERDIATVRNLSYDLGTPGLRGRGLVTALSHYCREFSGRTGLSVAFDAVGVDEAEVNPDIGTNLYRVVQEGLNNILKHAVATRATVRLVGSFPDLILSITDDGQGFDVTKRLEALTSEKRMGLRSMQERVTLLRGKMVVQSRIGAGTEISIRVPYQEETRSGTQEVHRHH